MSTPLNSSQREAVRRCDGPLLVIAGAGSGKTRVITEKICYLIEQGVDPAGIIAITFTNKAAREMRDRAQSLLKARGKGELAGKITVATFHALGLKIMRSESVAMGLSRGFSIFDPSDLEAMIAELTGTADRGRARAAQWRISAWKNALVTPPAALRGATDEDELTAARAYANYGDALAAYQAVDFDDLIVRPVMLLESDAAAARSWQARCQHVLVDEYQDTNPAQYRLLRALVGERTPFTAVGDDDQAIYGWRGATLDNLDSLPRDYPNLAIVKLEQNYRSTVRILRCANQLITNNSKSFDKRLWSDLGTGDTIRVTPAANDEAEAEMVAHRISALKFERRASYADFAVLYRGNHQARILETAFRANGIPYDISGGQSWFDKTEIKDVVAYLRLIANEDDDPAFVRAITTPKRGIGQTTLRHLGALSTARGESLFASVFADGLHTHVPARQRETLEEFCSLINDVRVRAGREPAGGLLDGLLAAIGYEAWLADTLDRPEAEARTKSVREFVGWLSRKGEEDGRNLQELTQMIALITMLDDRDGAGIDAVSLSTLHAAKGLEFQHVFIVGLEEGILPHRTSIDAGNVEEERRLMYVGVTRARQSLHLSYCNRRKRAGVTMSCVPSRFIGELAQADLRYANTPLPLDEAEREKAAGSERLKSMKAMLVR